jgi:hypothetical protein
MASHSLSKLVAILKASPAMYIADSGIWSYPGDENLKLALADIVEDQKNIAEQASILLGEREEPIPQTGYPLAYTAWHDLDLIFLLPRLIQGMQNQVAGIEHLDISEEDSATRDLSRQAKATTLGHIDVLEQHLSRLRRLSTSA